MDRLATTPFGGGRFTAADFRTQVRIEEERERVARRRAAASANDTGRADKWQLLRALTEAKDQFGLGDRTIRVLEALLSFHSSREIDGAEPIIVFPSNKELSLRTRGMAPVTIRRHIRALVTAALLVRRDSPNGKRYCVRDERGEVDEVFGFDLSPLALQAATIHEAAERAREHLAKVRKIRAEITIHLRDVSRIIETARDEERFGDWDELAARLDDLSGRVGRFTPLAEHEVRRAALAVLRRDAEDAYLRSMSEHELIANDARTDRHIQNSKTEPHIESNGLDIDKGSERPAASDEQCAGGVKGTENGTWDGGDDTRISISLGLLRLACPEFLSYAANGLKTWRDVVSHAQAMRPMLGISADAMRRADSAMGSVDAAITLAAILQRQEHVRSPGGYLRALTRRAEHGQFSVRPMIDALVPKP